MKVRDVLLDAKKACGCAATMATAAAAAGVIDGHLAAEIVGVTGVLVTGVVYALGNRATDDGDTGPGSVS